MLRAVFVDSRTHSKARMTSMHATPVADRYINGGPSTSSNHSGHTCPAPRCHGVDEERHITFWCDFAPLGRILWNAVGTFIQELEISSNI